MSLKHDRQPSWDSPGSKASRRPAFNQSMLLKLQLLLLKSDLKWWWNHDFSTASAPVSPGHNAARRCLRGHLCNKSSHRCSLREVVYHSRGGSVWRGSCQLWLDFAQTKGLKTSWQLWRVQPGVYENPEWTCFSYFTYIAVICGMGQPHELGSYAGLLTSYCILPPQINGYLSCKKQECSQISPANIWI